MPGAGNSSQQTTSQRDPWAPAIPMLKDLLTNIRGQAAGNWNTTGYEQNALNEMKRNANNLPDYGQQAGDITSSFLGGDPSGLLSPALKAYQDQMNPIANASLDPTQSPGMSNVLDTIRSDVSNNVNGLFAGAGRDLSGAHAQALGRGISQGEAVPLLNQYNQNVQNRMGAANGLLGASGTTAEALGKNQARGFAFADLVPQMMNQGPMAQLQAMAMQRGLPLQNLAQLEGLTIPIAGLGGQAKSSTQGTQPFAQTLAQLGSDFSNLTKGAGTGLGGLGSLF